MCFDSYLWDLEEKGRVVLDNLPPAWYTLSIEGGTDHPAGNHKGRAIMIDGIQRHRHYCGAIDPADDGEWVKYEDFVEWAGRVQQAVDCERAMAQPTRWGGTNHEAAMADLDSLLGVAE